MRILHTSDWHLGQHFIGRSRASEHSAFLHWLTEQAEQLQIDAIIVAGDLFDTATPPSYARELYNQFIVSLQRCGCQLVVLAGNHDAAAVLNESKGLLHYLNTQVITAPAEQPEQQLIILKNRQQQPAAILCAIPFLRPRDLLLSQRGQSATDKSSDLQQAIHAHYQTLYTAAELYNSQQQTDLPVIMTGHLTTVGAKTSESVRDIYIGTLEALPASAFPPADYIALGHIHKSQQINAPGDIRYSGSPIALSFDEANQQKQLWLVEFAGREKTVSSVAIPCFQPLLSITTALAQLSEKVTQALNNLPPQQRLWLEVVVSEQDGYLSDLQQQVEQQLADLPVELLRLRRQRKTDVNSLQTDSQISLTELTPEQVWQSRLQLETLSSEQLQQLNALHQLVLNKVLEAG